MRSMVAVMLVFVITGSSGCGKRTNQPAGGSAEGSATPTAVVDDAPSGAGAGSAGSGQVGTAVDTQPAITPWEVAIAPVELACGAAPKVTGGYKVALDAGRAAGKAKRWGEAIAAFEHALVERKDDPVVLSELSVALLHAGDAVRALELGGRAVAATEDLKAKAAAHYNAGRAAEALADLVAAKAHYETSIALRPSEAVQARLGKLTAGATRSLPPAPTLAACQDLPSADAACACLAKATEAWGSAAGFDGPGTCELATSGGALGKLVLVRATSESDTIVSRSALVLITKRGASWSALQLIETTPEVDRDETPRAAHDATPLRYEERPIDGGTLLWVQSENAYTDTGAGERDAVGDAGLTVCVVPSAIGSPPWCLARQPIASWSHSSSAFDDAEPCEARVALSYRATLASSGLLTLVLAEGVDVEGRAGSYQFRTR